jgi:hypothetical protein
MKKYLRKILFGDIPVSEYSTVTINGDIVERVHLLSGGQTFDISSTHWLLCLDPLVFGIWFPSNGPAIPFDKEAKYKMHFNDSAENADTVAILKLHFFDKIEESDGTLLLLKLISTETHHISLIKTLLLFYRHYKKPEQNLHKLKSYSSAYSYPRRVRIISFREGDYYNIFPMDLVGDIPGSKRYVFGLRHTNATLPRIIATKKMSVSEVPYDFKETIYQLGKHHKNPLSAASAPFKLLPSEIYSFPIPEWAYSYKEIKIHKTRDLGSHMLLWGEEINEKLLRNTHGHLFHIHFLHYLHQKKRGFDYPLI